MTVAIKVKGLRKAYGSNEAVRGIDLRVDEGECVAVLGPNGAGKTTTVEILEGFRERDAGEVSVLGLDPAVGGRPLRERIGIVLQECGVERFLTVGELLRLHAGYYPHPLDPEQVLEMVDITEKADAKVKTLSGGQQRRVDLALGLIGDPELVFLDEPTTGFDPTARRAAWSIVSNLRELGKTVLLTTHYMDEAQNLADRVVVVARGQVVAEGAPDEIGGRGDAEAQVRFVLPRGIALTDLPGTFRTDGDLAVAQTDNPTALLHVVTGWALDRGIVLPGLTVSRPSLEDVYLELTAE